MESHNYRAQTNPLHREEETQAHRQRHTTQMGDYKINQLHGVLAYAMRHYRETIKSNEHTTYSTSCLKRPLKKTTKRWLSKPIIS